MEGYLRIKIIPRKPQRVDNKAEIQTEVADYVNEQIIPKRHSEVIHIPSGFTSYKTYQTREGSKYEIFKNFTGNFILKVTIGNKEKLHKIGSIDDSKSYI